MVHPYNVILGFPGGLVEKKTLPTGFSVDVFLVLLGTYWGRYMVINGQVGLLDSMETLSTL